MRFLSYRDWTQRSLSHKKMMEPAADVFLARRSRGEKHPVYDFLFTYYTFSPTKLKLWVPSFEEVLSIDEKTDLSCFDGPWFQREENTLRLKSERLHSQTLALAAFIQELCEAVSARAPRFGCFGLHEWAMVYRMTQNELRHADYPLRVSPDELARFVESQNLCCTHYDAYRFFTPQIKPLNSLQPTLSSRLQNEQAGCLHANMDLYKWSTKLWPWIGSDFIAKTFLLAMQGRELDMRASPYDLRKEGYTPICIETEMGKKEYVTLQQKYTEKALTLRQELSAFCRRLHAWKTKT